MSTRTIDPQIIRAEIILASIGHAPEPTEVELRQIAEHIAAIPKTMATTVEAAR
jgi:ribulose 1,5-bisphosphate synthetase/thiazole synthase